MLAVGPGSRQATWSMGGPEALRIPGSNYSRRLKEKVE